jgi:hypothetical protein
MFALMPDKGAKVSKGISSNAFAREPGMKNSNTNITRYNNTTERYGDCPLIKLWKII